MIHASLHHVTGVASPLSDPPHRGPPTTQGLRVTETGRQRGKVGPNGMEGGGLLVFLAWRSRALGMVRAQNKVVQCEAGRARVPMGQLVRQFGSPWILVRLVLLLQRGCRR